MDAEVIRGIPSDFWDYFAGDIVREDVSSVSPLLRGRLYADGHSTFEDWASGHFRICFPDGRSITAFEPLLAKAVLPFTAH